MLSLCHIFSDAKFVDLTLDYFKSDLFINKAIFIGNCKSYKGIYKNLIEFIDYGKNGVENIIKICCNHDVIIFHNLDYYKSVIANRLPIGTKMVWFFYGTEFYSIPQYQFNIFTDKTKDAMNINRFYHIKIHITNMLRIIKYALQLKMTPMAEFNRAVNKIDYILGWDKGEYSYIRQYWKTFPKFMELTALNKVKKISSLNDKNNIIVVGNSRGPENNHIDIIDIFENNLSAGSASLLLPLSYGIKWPYYFRLIDRIKSSKLEIEVLDNLLPFDVYAEKVVKAKAAINNSYRQMALGNIFLFLGNEVKVYLSERSTSYNNLRRLGFTIFSVETNLKDDIINNDLTLEPYQAERNRSILDNLSDDHNAINFHNNFHKYLSNSNPNP